MNTPLLAENLIEARQLVPTGEQMALNIQLRQHDSLFLIGPDSSRLRQYLRTLAGVEPAQQGELFLFGKSVWALDKSSWREQRQQIGFVSHNAPILSVLRGLENVMLPALYHKRLSRGEARAKARRLIAEIGYQGDYDKLPAFLSLQQRLQLAIARATILDPSILFIEQPFSGLSLAEQQPIYQYLLHCRERHALVITTHNLRLVMESATQILFIGERLLCHFDCWHALEQSGEAEIINYLSLHKQQYQLVQENE